MTLTSAHQQAADAISATLTGSTNYYVCYASSYAQTMYYNSTGTEQYYNTALSNGSVTFPTGTVSLSGGTHYGLSLYITVTPN